MLTKIEQVHIFMVTKYELHNDTMTNTFILT